MNYLIYITTNLINDKRYIGSHATTNVDDNYLGSGTIFKKALKKYGKQNFIKDILAYAPTRKRMLEIEEEICTYFDVENNDSFYNMVNRGTGSIKGKAKPIGFSDKLKQHFRSEKTKLQITNSMIGKNLNKNIGHKWNRNNNIYTFQHKINNELFIGTTYNFYTKYNLSSSNVNNMVLGKNKSVKGWTITNNKTN